MKQQPEHRQRHSLVLIRPDMSRCEASAEDKKGETEEQDMHTFQGCLDLTTQTFPSECTETTQTTKDKCEEEMKEQTESRQRHSLVLIRPDMSGVEASAVDKKRETEEQEQDVFSFPAKDKCEGEMKQQPEHRQRHSLVLIRPDMSGCEASALDEKRETEKQEQDVFSFPAEDKCEEEMKEQTESRQRHSLVLIRPDMSECEASAVDKKRETEELEQDVFSFPVNEVAVYSLQAPQPKNRAEFLKYSCQLTLDPNTAHRNLCLSEGNRKVAWKAETQPYPGHPERFDSLTQVLCREGLSGNRCYWEIEWSGGADIGITYKGIHRKGCDDSCALGYNDKSWSLLCSVSSYSAWHNNNETEVTAPRSHRIGVYLDFNAGTLSFYGVSDTMTLLHRFQTTFTEPLYPGVWLDCYDSTVSICQLY